MNLNKHFDLDWFLSYFVLMKGFMTIAFMTLFYRGLQAQIQIISDPRIEQRIAAKNNKQMNFTLENMMTKWNFIVGVNDALWIPSQIL